MIYFISILVLFLVVDIISAEHKRRKRLRDLDDHPVPIVHQQRPCIVSPWSNADNGYECASPRNEEGCDFYKQSKKTYTCVYRREHRRCTNEEAQISARADQALDDL